MPLLFLFIIIWSFKGPNAAMDWLAMVGGIALALLVVVSLVIGVMLVLS